MGVTINIVSSKTPADVSITIEDSGEKVYVNNISEIKINNSDIYRNVLASPILHEINLEKLSTIKANIYLDAQGYVRMKDSENFIRWQCKEENLRNVVVLKVNQHELPYVSKEIIDMFKQKILLITRGRDGVELWDHGVKHEIKGVPITTTNTIGAGDYFFATFTASKIQNHNSIVAAQLALCKTEEFLKSK
jgi:sugar/nucleoside kinase (ribokinase family)